MRTKTHCARGHELVGPNLYYRMRKGKRIRECRICNVRRRRDEGKRMRGPAARAADVVLTSTLIDLGVELEMAMPWDRPALEAQIAELRAKV